MKGWDIVSTIPNIEDDKVITLDENFLNRNRLSWFPTLDYNGFDSTNFDIEFMRRLNLSSKRILSSKGTQESIDMIMGMFGLGRNMKDIDSLTFHEISNIDDYEITEIYYNAYLNINKSLEEIENININRTSFSDPYGIELFNGLPLDILEIEGTSYIIPFYDKNKEYGHELVFQDKGGWCGNNINNYEYFETISYLNVVTNYEELLYITNLNCTKGDIYYVIDITDCAKYNITDIKSHFFICVDETKLGTTQGWLNINLNNKDDVSKKANYLNNIVNTKFGNNPHVGYGLYDKGENYREYMDKPFKYWLETADITNENDYNEA
ncbi:MAG: hypothetical protein K2H20_04975, partial [Bacilli bacterium]|nr:hypothetical protein [Bacilli bacterium]